MKTSSLMSLRCWAAVEVARHIDSDHRTLTMGVSKGTWDEVTGLLLHAGQPFADTSIFAVSAVCEQMRQHVSVALSGDGGDEAFGGYDIFREVSRLATLRRLPAALRGAAALLATPLARGGLPPARRLRDRFRYTLRADDVDFVQDQWMWLRPDEHRALCPVPGALPPRRFFERHWEHRLDPGASGARQHDVRAGHGHPMCDREPDS